MIVKCTVVLVRLGQAELSDIALGEVLGLLDPGQKVTVEYIPAAWSEDEGGTDMYRVTFGEIQTFDQEAFTNLNRHGETGWACLEFPEGATIIDDHAKIAGMCRKLPA